MLPGPGEEIAAFVIDLTERKRAEKSLRASETLYRTIARSIPGGGVYVVDKDMRYLVADGAVTEAFGLSREMLEGRTVSEVFHDQQRARMIERLNQNFAGEIVSYETEHNGRVYWTQQAPLFNSLGQAIIVTLDITERKKAEEDLRLLNLELEYRVQKRTSELAESRRRLQILTQRLVEVQEEERRAIARELHDRVGQTLSALNINLIIMRGQILPDLLERVGPRFDDSMQLVGETITLVRDVMSNLRPAVLDDYGLEAALQSHMDEFTDSLWDQGHLR